MAPSIIDLVFLSRVSCYEELTNGLLRQYLFEKAEQPREVVTLKRFEKLVQNELQMNVEDRDARSRVKSLIFSCRYFLHRDGIQLLTNENERAAVMHVLSVIRSMSLQCRLQSDLSLSHDRLKTNFKGFMAHASKLSEETQDSRQRTSQRREVQVS